MEKEIAQRKREVEDKFIELKTNKLKLIAQAQTLKQAVDLIDGQMVEMQGAFKELCGLLKLDYKKEAAEVEKRLKRKLEDGDKKPTEKKQKS